MSEWSKRFERQMGRAARHLGGGLVLVGMDVVQDVVGIWADPMAWLKWVAREWMPRRRRVQTWMMGSTGKPTEPRWIEDTGAGLEDEGLEDDPLGGEPTGDAGNELVVTGNELVVEGGLEAGTGELEGLRSLPRPPKVPSDLGPLG